MALPEIPMSDISSGKHLAMIDIYSSVSSKRAFFPLRILSYGGNSALHKSEYLDSLFELKSPSEIAEKQFEQQILQI